MKRIIQKIVGAALLLALPLSFTSCEDILGKWDKPIPPAVITLKNALDAGAQVQISYKIGDTPHTATFLKEGDAYNLVGDGNPEEQMLTYDEDNNRLIYTELGDVTTTMGPINTPMFYIFFDIEKTSFFVINYYKNVSFDGNINIQGTTITIPNACPKKATIAYKNATSEDVVFNYDINYAEGDTWQDVADRFASYGFAGNFILINPETSNVESGTPVKYFPGGTEGDPVLKNHFVGKDGSGNAYNVEYVVVTTGGGGIVISGPVEMD